MDFFLFSEIIGVLCIAGAVVPVPKFKRRLYRRLFALLTTVPCVGILLIPYMTFGTSILYLAAWIAVFIFLIKLIANGLEYYTQLFDHDKKGDWVVKLIRSGIPILFFIEYLVTSRMIFPAAQDYAIQTAESIQEICQRDGICPESIQGWEDNEMWFGKYGRKLQLTYHTNDEG